MEWLWQMVGRRPKGVGDQSHEQVPEPVGLEREETRTHEEPPEREHTRPVHAARGPLCGARVACPHCGTQNAFSTDGRRERVKVKCGRCSRKFKAQLLRALPEEAPLGLRLCASCGTLNTFIRHEQDPDLLCGHCGEVSPPQSLDLVDEDMSSAAGPSVHIELGGQRRVLPLQALLTLMAQQLPPGNAASSEDIDALPTHRLEGNIGEQTRCSVCLEDFANGDQLMTLPCLHLYHQCCVERWLHADNSCPLCKTPIS